MSYLEILVLATLAHEPAHGYEIRRKVERVLSGAVSLNPNVLYPMLHRFEDMGAVEKTVEPQVGRPARHVYRMTSQGDEVLAELLREFGPGDGPSDAEFRTRVAFFDRISRSDRAAILDARQSALAGLLGQMLAHQSNEPSGTWHRVVLDQAIEQVRLEQRFVDELRPLALGAGVEPRTGGAAGGAAR